MTDERNGYIALEGADQVVKALAGADQAVVKAAFDGLETAAQEIINDAKDNLRQNGNIVTGLLRSSGHVIRKGNDITAGFFDTTNRNSGYALYLEFGRRAGRMPPPDEIAAWVYKRFHLKDWKAANSLGWAIAKRIAVEGTDPHPFFVPAVNKRTKGGEMSGVAGSVAKAVMKILRGATARFAAEGRRIRNTPKDN